MTTPGAPRTAAELLEEGLCSARCLLALADGPCDCPCKGRWHAALTAADVGEGISPAEQAKHRAEKQAGKRAAPPRAADGRGRGRKPGPPQPPGAREFPGAPVSDRRAFQVRRHPDGTLHAATVGLTLGSHAEALVLAALAAVPEGSSLRVVCAEANRIKASRPDLDGFRYLSLAACARAIREITTTERTTT